MEQPRSPPLAGRQTAEQGRSDHYSALAQLEQRFNEAESSLAQARQLAMQTFQSLTLDTSASLNGIQSEAVPNGDAFLDLLDFDLVPWEESMPSSIPQTLYNQGPTHPPGAMALRGFNATKSSTQPRMAPQPSRFCLDFLELEGSVSLDSLVQKMLALLVSDKYWSDTRTWYFETIGFEKLAPITRYRIAPTIENYLAIQPGFRPTQLQMTKFHWPMVDWFPFPGIRDKMILHADEINLTDVLLASMQSFCLESQLDESENHQSSPFGGTDPYLSRGLSRENGDSHLFHNSENKRLVYYRLTEWIEYNTGQSQAGPNMTGGIRKSVEAEFIMALGEITQILRLEKTFFTRFPLLYCEEALVRGEYRPLIDYEYTGM